MSLNSQGPGAERHPTNMELNVGLLGERGMLFFVCFFY